MPPLNNAHTAMAVVAVDHTQPTPSTVDLGGRTVSGTQQDVFADLATVIRMLSLAHDLAAVRDVLGRAAQVLLSADGATLVGVDAGVCCARLVPACDQAKLLGDATDRCPGSTTMRRPTLTVIEDALEDDCEHGEGCQLAGRRGVALAPIRSSEPIGALAIYWTAPHIANDHETGLLEVLANATAMALESLFRRANFDQRIAERTAALDRQASELHAANVRLCIEVNEQRREAQYDREMALTDDLTGIANRRGFRHLAEQALATCRRHAQPALVVFVDVDDLKAVNDEQGHEEGDAVLRRVAHGLTATLRESDIAGRWGGDEFVALLPETDDVDRFRDRLDAHVREQNLDVSIGIITVPPDDDTPLSDLLARADTLMYADKHTRGLDRDSQVLQTCRP